MRFIAKKDTWFDEGTEAVLLGESWVGFADPALTIRADAGLFAGIRDGKPDEEVCGLDEFDIIE